MQIKTITCHDVYNHGASLQAYALQTYLESLGHHVEIIDYKPDYLSSEYKLWVVANPVYDKPFIRLLYLMVKLPNRLYSLKRKKAFDSFTKKFLKLTNHRFETYDQLNEAGLEADIFIAGSDQIWNTFLPNGMDPAFYLDFAPKTSKRISYGASLATESVAEEKKEFVCKMLQNFDVVSIRERSSLPLLESLGRKDGQVVCDPVFLLTKKQWLKLLPVEALNERYLLIYDTECSDRLKCIAQRIAKERDLRIYNVSAFKMNFADNNLWASSPMDFVRLIRDAEYIVSNSFHASAFSIIFEKNFCVVNRSENINERMKSLLKDINLEDRLIADYSTSLMDPIKYSKAALMLKRNIDSSIEFLRNALS